jgi:hypothetical protein
MEELSRVIKINIKGKEYEVSFPTNGQLIDIESNKILLSKNTSGKMLYGNTASSLSAYRTVDMIATFSVLIPDLIKNINGKSLLKLSPIDTVELLDVYENKYYAWFSKWQEEINKKFKELSKDSKPELLNEVEE